MGPISRENFYFVNRVVGHSLCSGSKISGRPNFTISPIFVDIPRKPLLAQTVHAQTFCREFKGVSNAGFKINVALKLWKLSYNFGQKNLKKSAAGHKMLKLAQIWAMRVYPLICRSHRQNWLSNEKKRLELSSTTLEIKILENCEKKG